MGFGFTVLRLLHQLDQLTESGIFADLLGSQGHGSADQEGAGENLIPLPFMAGVRLSGYAGLIHMAFAIQNDPIDRDLAPGFDQEVIALVYVVDIHFDGVTVDWGDDFQSRLWGHGDQVLDGLPGLFERRLLQEIS